MNVEIGSYRITVVRLATFSALVAVFFGWFGYWPGSLRENAYYLHDAAARGYFYSGLLFVASAGFACFSDHQFGYFPPTSLRPVALGAGTVLMCIAIIWMHSLRETYVN